MNDVQSRLGKVFHLQKKHIGDDDKTPIDESRQKITTILVRNSLRLSSAFPFNRTVCVYTYQVLI